MNTGDVVGKDRGENLIDTGRCPVAICGNHVYVLESQYERLLETGESFYCAGGHGQSFTTRPKINERKRRIEELERQVNAERERAAREQAQAEEERKRASRARRTCPWPTCEGRVLRSERQLRQHLVDHHGAPWATPEISADEIGQVLNGRKPSEVVK